MDSKTKKIWFLVQTSRSPYVPKNANNSDLSQHLFTQNSVTPAWNYSIKISFENSDLFISFRLSKYCFWSRHQRAKSSNKKKFLLILVIHLIRSLSFGNNRLDWFNQGRNQNPRSSTSVIDERTFFDLLLNFLVVRRFEKLLLIMIGRVVQTRSIP